MSNQGKIEFTSASTRNDVTVTTGQYRINEIKIVGKDNSLLKYFQLGQSFVQSSGSTPSTATTSTYRMYLDDVREYSAASTLVNTQTFEYYSRSSLPPRLSYKQDHWGYFNNKNNTQLSPSPNSETELLYVQTKFPAFTPANRNPDAAASYFGTLKKVTYPTGGATEYEFEGNETAICQSVDVPTNVTAATALTFSGSPQTLTVNFFVDHDQWVNINYDVLMNGFRCDGASARVRTTDSGNPFVTLTWGGCNQMTSPIQFHGNINKYMKTGNYELEVKVFQGPESGYPAPFGTQPETASITVKHVDNVPTYITNKASGGIRLKKLTTSDGATGASTDIIKALQYHKANNAGCSNASSGVYLGRAPRYSSSDYQAIDIPGGISCDYNLCQYSNITSSSLFNLTNNAGAIVAYAEVWALEGVNGKKYYLHEIFQDGNGLSGTNFYDVYLNTPTVDYSWKSGRVKEEKTFSSTGQLILHNLFEYEFNEINNKHTLSGFLARQAIAPCLIGPFTYYCDGENDEGEEYNATCDWLGNCLYNYYPCYNQPSGTQITNTSQMEPYAVEWYSIVSQFVYLKKKTERQYSSDGSGNFVETVQDYQYDTPAFRHLLPIKTITTNSGGDEYATLNKYAPQYTTTTVTDIASVAIKALNDNFIINQPIESVQTIKRGGVEIVTGGHLIKFKNFGSANIQSNEFWSVGTTAPISLGNFSFSTITGGNFIIDARYYHVSSQGAYDSKGNLLEWNKKDDPAKKQYIWGHLNSLPIAEVVNAEGNEIAFTSFEDPPSVCLSPLGNWQFQGACSGWNNTAGNYVTGRTGFNLSPARTMSCTVPAGKYRVSAWHKDGSFIVNGTTVSTSTGGQWKYAEKELTFASSGTVSISSGGSDWSQYIDELRLCPSDALIRTYSFDDRNNHLLSVSDENCVSGHFEYDNSQRLQIVRDQDRNILQTYEYNYLAGAINEVKSRTVLLTGQTTVAQVNALTGSNVRRIFQYLDGLGRPIQTNEVEQSPTAKDVVSYHLYDAFSRELKQYIPYTIATNGGAYRSGYATEQTAFTDNFGAGGYGYSEIRFEASPQNRPLEKGAPGAIWRIGVGHTLESSYRGNFNSTNETVRNFTTSANFAANDLSTTEELDENERKKVTFTDKLGRVVLVKQQINNTVSNPPTVDDYALTYTLYDDFGRVAAVIPPETIKIMINSNNWDWTSATYASMVFKYAYDIRGRMISKTVPSGGTTTIAYDKLDRPVLTTDANGFKTFTRYDILGRPVVTGKYKGTAVPAATDPLYETPNTTGPHYYTTTTFPVDNNLDVYKVLYYDDYDLNNDGSIPANESYTNPAETPFETAAFLRTRGKPTATRTGILLNSGAAPTTFLTTRTYYDKEYSVIQVNKQNHLSGNDISSSAYDFANRLIKSRRDHTATPPGGTAKNYVVREEYVLDHAGRVVFVIHQIGTQKKEIIAASKYDELNRLTEKNLHASNFTGTPIPVPGTSYNYLQGLDYGYNIRGWLTGMNVPTSCALQAPDNIADLFYMGIDYESNANGASPQYNGNIAAIQWRTNIASCGIRQQYRFTYDAANRLKTADHYTHNGAVWTFTNAYTESNVSYDLNGNIKSYNRRGILTGGTVGTIDQLTYTYGDALRPDRLTQMADGGDGAKGFKRTTGLTGDHYIYDANGNMTQDKHKGFVFAYNCLNLPITMTKGANVITTTYTADGEKLTKSVTGGGATKNYVSGIEYSGANVEAIYHSEGRLTPNGANFHYEYSIKDHLGNARVSFRAITNGTAIQALQENHYYPFGMEMEGAWLTQVGAENPYEYNGKELNEDFGLNLYDYGARWYDAAIGRWGSVDPLGEKTMTWSTYAYVFNNPLRFIDPSGMTGEPVINGNTITIQSEFVFYGNVRGNEKNLKKEVKRAEKAWNDANAEVEIDGKKYRIQFKISAKVVKTSDYEYAKDAVGTKSGRSFIEVCSTCETAIEHGGGSGRLNTKDILNDARSFTHEYGHENGFIDDSQFENSSTGHHDEKGLIGEDGQIPSIMTARNTSANAPNSYGLPSFSPNATTEIIGTDGNAKRVIDATKRSNPTAREVNMLINNGQELLLEKIRPKIHN